MVIRGKMSPKPRGILLFVSEALFLFVNFVIRDRLRGRDLGTLRLKYLTIVLMTFISSDV